MRQGQGKLHASVPSVWLMTDERVTEGALMRGIARLPHGSVVVLRHYGLAADERYGLFRRVRKAARRRNCKVLLAGWPDLARRWGADGHHGRGRTPAFKGWLHSAAVHDLSELRSAEALGADVVLLSPLFSTRSHPGQPSLGSARFAAIARRSKLPVIALGGVHPRHAAMVRQLGAVGFAAIDGLTGRRRSI